MNRYLILSPTSQRSQFLGMVSFDPYLLTTDLCHNISPALSPSSCNQYLLTAYIYNNNIMAITASQNDLLNRLQTSYANGLTSGEASQRRRDETIGGPNSVNPPINCPKWVCCLLWVL